MKYVIALIDPFGQTLHETDYEAEDITLPNDEEPSDVLSALMGDGRMRRVLVDPESRAPYQVTIERRTA